MIVGRRKRRRSTVKYCSGDSACCVCVRTKNLVVNNRTVALVVYITLLDTAANYKSSLELGGYDLLELDQVGGKATDALGELLCGHGILVQG